MTHRLILIFALLIVSGILPASGQRLRDKEPVPVQAKDATEYPRPRKTQAAAAAADTVYSRNFTKRNGWIIPMGEISQEQMSHRNQSFRFTRRNSRGHWLRVDAVDSYGRLQEGIFDPYLIKMGNTDADGGADRQWVERLKHTAILEIVPDVGGERVVQERVYDSAHNIVYIYTVTPIGTDSLGHPRYVGTYRNAIGHFADMRPDTTGTYTYGTLVMLTHDRCGHDSIVEFMDAKGLKRPNADGVAMESRVYDDAGDCVLIRSHDAEGRPVHDLVSNCGTGLVYADHQLIQMTYLDTLGRPMILNPPYSLDSRGVSSVILTHDRHGRQTGFSYADTCGRPIAAANGLGRCAAEYDGRGNPIEMTYFGIDGRPIVPVDGFAAIIRNRFDHRGRLLQSDYLDAQDLPVSKDGYYCREVREYDDDSDVPALLQTFTTDGHSIRRSYCSERRPWGIRVVYSDGSSQIDSIDRRGNTTYTGYFAPDGSPADVGAWATMHRRYTYGQSTTEYTEVFRSANGSLATSGHAFKKASIDSVAGTEYIRRFRADSVLFDATILCHSPGYGPVTHEINVNRFGRPSRTGSSGLVRFLYADCLFAQTDSPNLIAAIMGRDEFGEPDYIVTPGNVFYYQRNSIQYDEDNHPITNYFAARDSLPKVMSIEVTDSIAYSLGLLDNDIVVAEGVYGCDPRNPVAESQFRGNHALATVLNGSRSRSMTVLRADTAARCFRAITLPDISGYLSQNGILLHERFLTRRQLDRIGRAIDSLPTPLPETIATGAHSAVFTTSDAHICERRQPYPSEVTDPAILLGIAVPELGLSWRAGMDDDGIHTLLKARSADPRHVAPISLYLTKDGRTVQTVATDSLNLGVVFLENHIADDLHRAISPIAKVVSYTIDSIMAAGPSTTPTMKKLRGTYSLVSDTPSDRLTITIAKNGTCVTSGSTIASFKDVTGAEIIVRINFDDTPRRVNDCTLPLTVGATFSTIELINAPAGDPDELKSQIDWVLNNSEHSLRFINMMQWASPILTSRLHIGSYSDGSLKITNDTGTILNFVKID